MSMVRILRRKKNGNEARETRKLDDNPTLKKRAVEILSPLPENANLTPEALVASSEEDPAHLSLSDQEVQYLFDHVPPRLLPRAWVNWIVAETIPEKIPQEWENFLKDNIEIENKNNFETFKNGRS